MGQNLLEGLGACRKTLGIAGPCVLASLDGGARRQNLAELIAGLPPKRRGGLKPHLDSAHLTNPCSNGDIMKRESEVRFLKTCVKMGWICTVGYVVDVDGSRRSKSPEDVGMSQLRWERTQYLGAILGANGTDVIDNHVAVRNNLDRDLCFTWVSINPPSCASFRVQRLLRPGYWKDTL